MAAKYDFHHMVLQWGMCQPDEPDPTERLLQDTMKRYPQLPASFPDARSYSQFYQPMLLHECRHQLKAALESSRHSNALPLIQLRQYTRHRQHFIHTVFDVNPSVCSQIQQDTVCILVKNDRLRGREERVLGIVKKVAFHLARCSLLHTYPNDAFNDAAAVTSSWQLVRLMDFAFTTYERMYSSLSGLTLSTIPIFPQILSARPLTATRSTLHSIPDLLLPNFSQYLLHLQQSLNEAQLDAVAASVDPRTDKQFTLVHGPPGTGKTSTIIGILNTQYNISRFGYLERGKKAMRFLICCPSNAAVDELVSRIQDGLVWLDGNRVHPDVLRVGQEGATAVLDYTLEQRAAVYLNDRNKADKISTLMAEQKRLYTLQAKEKSYYNRNLINERLEQVALDIKRYQAGRNADVRRSLLNNAEIVCTTLSSSGLSMFSMVESDFPFVIIDEAAQANEVESLIPLRYQCRKCILVGDVKQLPPTVTSKIASDAGFWRSLFERLVDAKHPSLLLNQQHRMHPQISRFPMKEFYGGKVQDAAIVSSAAFQFDFHSHPDFGPYRFFNLRYSRERKSISITNEDEVLFIRNFLRYFNTKFRQSVLKCSIGVLTPYKDQQVKLQQELSDLMQDQVLSRSDIRTVDGFQGQERDIIILSTVRSSYQIGFLNDIRRMNVALTRSRLALYIVGNAESLSQGATPWKDLVEDALTRRKLLTFDSVSDVCVQFGMIPTVYNSHRGSTTSSLLKLDSSSSSSSHPADVSLVRLTGIPPRTKPEQIADFFKGFPIVSHNGIFLEVDGGNRHQTGVAYVRFSTPTAATEALDLDLDYFAHRSITVSLARPQDVHRLQGSWFSPVLSRSDPTRSASARVPPSLAQRSLPTTSSSSTTTTSTSTSTSSASTSAIPTATNAGSMQQQQQQQLRIVDWYICPLCQGRFPVSQRASHFDEHVRAMMLKRQHQANGTSTSSSSTGISSSSSSIVTTGGSHSRSESSSRSHVEKQAAVNKFAPKPLAIVDDSVSKRPPHRPLPSTTTSTTSSSSTSSSISSSSISSSSISSSSSSGHNATTATSSSRKYSTYNTGSSTPAITVSSVDAPSHHRTRSASPTPSFIKSPTLIPLKEMKKRTRTAARSPSLPPTTNTINTSRTSGSSTSSSTGMAVETAVATTTTVASAASAASHSAKRKKLKVSREPSPAPPNPHKHKSTTGSRHSSMSSSPSFPSHLDPQEFQLPSSPPLPPPMSLDTPAPAPAAPPSPPIDWDSLCQYCVQSSFPIPTLATNTNSSTQPELLTCFISMGEFTLECSPIHQQDLPAMLNNVAPLLKFQLGSRSFSVAPTTATSTSETTSTATTATTATTAPIAATATTDTGNMEVDQSGDQDAAAAAAVEEEEEEEDQVVVVVESDSDDAEAGDASSDIDLSRELEDLVRKKHGL